MRRDNVTPGLEDVTVAATRLSEIDGENGTLRIGGISVEELAPAATFEESVYLLFNDRLPTESELDRFRAELAEERSLSAETIETVKAAAAADKPPMDALRMGLASSTLGFDDGDPRADARRVIAAAPSVVAAYWRARSGEALLEPDPSMGHAADYLRMMTGERPEATAVRGLETYLNAVIDHGLNASTFSARVVVSTESDLVSAATAAVGTLKGPLHGGAPGPVLDMLEDIHDGADPAAYVEETLAAGERLMGFGHRVYRVRDPRAAVLEAAAKRFYERDGDEAFLESARSFERVAVDKLEEHKPGRRLETNVEFYTAVLLNGIGIPRDLFTPTFGVARTGGWMAHCLEQLEDNRLVRPRSLYVGEARSWVPIDER